MNKYKLVEKILGSKSCPECGKTLMIDSDVAYCICGYEATLEYKDRNRNKNKNTLNQYKKRGKSNLEMWD